MPTISPDQPLTNNSRNCFVINEKNTEISIEKKSLSFDKMDQLKSRKARADNEQATGLNDLIDSKYLLKSDIFGMKTDNKNLQASIMSSDTNNDTVFASHDSTKNLGGSVLWKSDTSVTDDYDELASRLEKLKKERKFFPNLSFNNRFKITSLDFTHGFSYFSLPAQYAQYNNYFMRIKTHHELLRNIQLIGKKKITKDLTHQKEKNIVDSVFDRIKVRNMGSSDNLNLNADEFHCIKKHICNVYQHLKSYGDDFVYGKLDQSSADFFHSKLKSLANIIKDVCKDQ